MSWLELALLAAVLIGIAAGVALVLQRPSFWYGLGAEVARRVTPVVLRFVMKRMTPEEEAKWRREQQAGRGDEWNKRRRR